MTYWASVLAALGWLYAALASLWPLLFNRGIVKSGERDKLGYRIGLWKIYWRLPTRTAVVIALLSAIPILAAVWMDGWLLTAVLATMTGLTLFFWLFAPPGMTIEYVQKGLKDGLPVLDARDHRGRSRSVLVFAIFGLIPALGIGAILNWLFKFAL